MSGATGSGRVLDVSADIPYGTGNRVLITLTGTLNPSFTGDIVNSATALADGQPVLSNTVTTHIVNKTALQLVKIGPAETVAGQPIAYIIYITNFGPSVANAVELDDVVPNEVQNVSWKAHTAGNATIQGATQERGTTLC